MPRLSIRQIYEALQLALNHPLGPPLSTFPDGLDSALAPRLCMPRGSSSVLCTGFAQIVKSTPLPAEGLYRGFSSSLMMGSVSLEDSRLNVPKGC